jgi:hypothetical protein
VLGLIRPTLTIPTKSRLILMIISHIWRISDLIVKLNVEINVQIRFNYVMHFNMIATENVDFML